MNQHTKKRLAVTFAALIAALAACEGLLRWQQRLGPFVELADLRADLDESLVASAITHHRRGRSQDEVTTSTIPAGCVSADRTVRILFLGDSWMYEGGIVEGFGRHASPLVGPGVCLELLNGGVPSFAPSLMLVEGLRLIDRHHPDLVVANIDESDLMDETVRYKPYVIRDARGAIERVSAPAMALRLAALQETGMTAIESHPLYVVRLAVKAYYVGLFPLLGKLTDPVAMTWNQYALMFGPQLSRNPRETHRAAIDYFDGILEEFVPRLSTALGSPNRLMITHHPHYLGVKELRSARNYNDVVSEIVREVCLKYGVTWYDATTDTGRLYGADFPHYFRWPQDTFSHLTHEGFLRYGEAIADRARDSLAVLIE